MNYYYYEGANVIYTTDAKGNKTSQNIYGLDENIVATIHYEDDGQHAYTYSNNIQGSTYAIVDEKGCFVVGYNYDDFGETEKIGDSTFLNEICYTGAVYDELTGLHYLNARYYNPDTAIFLSQDTYRGEKTDCGSWNLYAYCAGNPIKYVDPSGHFLDVLWDVASIAVSTVNFVKKTTWQNAGWLALDIVSAVVPFVPAVGGVAVVGGAKVVSKGISKADDAVKAVKNSKVVKKAAKVVKSKAKTASSKAKSVISKAKNKAKKVFGGSKKPNVKGKSASKAVSSSNSGFITSRINVANGPTRFSPSKNAGLQHVIDRHFSPGKNAGQFSISVNELKNILGRKDIIKAAGTTSDVSGQYTRVVNVGKVVGTIKPGIPKVGGKKPLGLQ